MDPASDPGVLAVEAVPTPLTALTPLTVPLGTPPLATPLILASKDLVLERGMVRYEDPLLKELFLLDDP